MKLFRTAALAGLAHRAYVEARKPQNQARLKEAAAKLRQRKASGRR
jgi:hypothetical protein